MAASVVLKSTFFDEENNKQGRRKKCAWIKSIIIEPSLANDRCEYITYIIYIYINIHSHKKYIFNNYIKHILSWKLVPCPVEYLSNKNSIAIHINIIKSQLPKDFGLRSIS